MRTSSCAPTDIRPATWRCWSMRPGKACGRWMRRLRPQPNSERSQPNDASPSGVLLARTFLRRRRACAQVRRIELSAKDEDRCRPVEKHQRYHGGGEAGVGVHIGERKFCEIAAEAGGGDEPEDQ